MNRLPGRDGLGRLLGAVAAVRPRGAEHHRQAGAVRRAQRARLREHDQDEAGKHENRLNDNFALSFRLVKVGNGSKSSNLGGLVFTGYIQ